jgi:hypothetical protein
MNPDEPEDAKKPYQKPTVSEVALRPEEAVLGNCKTVMVAGPTSTDCSSLGGCYSQGS